MALFINTMYQQQNQKNSDRILLSDSDLPKKQYPIDVLIDNVLNLSISKLLKWQILDAEFCNKYILNEEYQCVEETFLITFEYVLKRQPHLKYEDLKYTWKK
jgi:hypothetical protein